MQVSNGLQEVFQASRRDKIEPRLPGRTPSDRVLDSEPGGGPTRARPITNDVQPERLMDIPMALLADEANVSQEGKLNVLGVFDRIAASSFPVVHPKMVFVFRVRAEYADAGRTFPVRVRLMDEDGATLFEASGDIAAPQVSPGEFVTANQLFTLVGTRFPRAGSYKFVVNVGDLAGQETPLVVVEVGSAGP